MSWQPWPRYLTRFIQAAQRQDERVHRRLFASYLVTQATTKRYASPEVMFRGRQLVLNPGQAYFTMSGLARELGMSRNTAKRMLAELRKFQNLATDHQVDHQADHQVDHQVDHWGYIVTLYNPTSLFNKQKEVDHQADHQVDHQAGWSADHYTETEETIETTSKQEGADPMFDLGVEESDFPEDALCAIGVSDAAKQWARVVHHIYRVRLGVFQKGAGLFDYLDLARWFDRDLRKAFPEVKDWPALLDNYEGYWAAESRQSEYPAGFRAKTTLRNWLKREGRHGGKKRQGDTRGRAGAAVTTKRWRG